MVTTGSSPRGITHHHNNNNNTTAWIGHHGLSTYFIDRRHYHHDYHYHIDDHHHINIFHIHYHICYRESFLKRFSERHAAAFLLFLFFFFSHHFLFIGTPFHMQKRVSLFSRSFSACHQFSCPFLPLYFSLRDVEGGIFSFSFSGVAMACRFILMLFIFFEKIRVMMPLTFPREIFIFI